MRMSSKFISSRWLGHLSLLWLLSFAALKSVKVYSFVIERRISRRLYGLRGRSTPTPLWYVNGEDPAAANDTGSNTDHHSQPHSQRIVFGTAALSKAKNPFELLDAAYEKGLHRFDLARSYGGGDSEKVFGEWMESRKIDRDSVYIITKGGMGQDKYGDPNRPILTRKSLQDEVEASLAALKTEYVDMYMFHRDDPRLDVSQFVLWANELVSNHITKQWGVSNWSFERFRQAYEFAIDHHLEPPRANSPQFSLAIPQCEIWPTTESISGESYKQQIQWYEENNVELLCWEVLAKGFMAKPNMWSEETVDQDQFYKTIPIGTDEWRLQRLQRAYCHDQNYHRRRMAVQFAQKHDLKLSHVAMHFILSMGTNVSVIFGSNNLDHVEDMVEVSEWELDEQAKMQLMSLPLSLPQQSQLARQKLVHEGAAVITAGDTLP